MLFWKMHFHIQFIHCSKMRFEGFLQYMRPNPQKILNWKLYFFVQWLMWLCWIIQIFYPWKFNTINSQWEHNLNLTSRLSSWTPYEYLLYCKFSYVSSDQLYLRFWSKSQYSINVFGSFDKPQKLFRAKSFLLKISEFNVIKKIRFGTEIHDM